MAVKKAQAVVRTTSGAVGETVHTDGRRARGERTRLAVLDALLHLVEQGELRPTAQAVAEEAGVALRTVYHHFEDVEALRRMALDLQLRRHGELLAPVDPKADLGDRIHLVARQCRKLFEAVTPIRRAAMFDEQSSPDMAEGLRRARLVRRNFVTAAFATELAKRSADGRTLHDAIDAATSWESWYYTRSSLDRSAAAAEKILALTLHDLLTGRSTSGR
jgi:AcrR family transcriptional regulator